jgi:hypothetical protein
LIYALWHQLEASGAIRHPGEPALVAFVEHVTGKHALRQLTVREASRVIETLKKWRARAGAQDRRH